MSPTHFLGHTGPFPALMQFYRIHRVNFRKFARSCRRRAPRPVRLPDASIESKMNDFWGNWIEAVRFTCEAQGVISARLMLFASGAPNAAEEATLMISEKIAAFTKAGMAAERALADGLGIYAAAEHAYSPLKHCVHANSNRLVGALL
jgi:hypothetical protein